MISWKMTVVLSIAMLSVTLLVRGCVGCLDSDARAIDQDRIDWVNFIAQHHCSVVPTRWYETNRWQCDGFQIEHY